MAKVPTFLLFGQSNLHGPASLVNLTIADQVRLFGFAAFASVPSQTTAFRDPSNQYLYGTGSIPGLNILQLKNNRVYRTRTVAAGSTINTLVISTPGFAVNTFAGCTVGVVGGVGTNQNRAVVSNTIDTLTVSNDWDVIPSNGDTCIIVGHKATGATSTTLVDAEEGWGVNSLTNFNVTIGTGTGTNQTRKIVSNTATVLTIDPPWLAATIPDATSVYMVYDPNAVTANSLTNPPSRISTYDVRPAMTGYYANASFPRTFVDYDFPSASAGYPTQGYTALFGPDLEFGWSFKNYMGQRVLLIKLGISGTFISDSLGNLTVGSLYWANAEWVDWSPATNKWFNFFVDKVVKIQAAQALALTGDTMDVVGIGSVIGEQDATDPIRAGSALTNMTRIRDEMRSRIAAAGLSSLSAERIPWVMAGIKTTQASNGLINTAYKTIAINDSYSAFVDTSTFTQGDSVHYDAAGMILLGRGMFNAWKNLLLRATSATTTTSSRLTLSSIRDRVKLRYARNTKANDAPNAVIDQFVNDAHREMFGTLGHSNWFMRQTETMTVTSDAATLFTFPSIVGDLLLIREISNPSYRYDFRMVTRTLEGLVQIVTPGTALSGDFLVDFMVRFKTLVTDGDVSPVPIEYIELIVVMASLRLGETSSDRSWKDDLIHAAKSLWESVWRQAHAADRARNEGWFTEQRNRSRDLWLARRDGPWLGW